MKITDEERKLLLIEIDREIYKKSFYEFLKQAVKILEPSTNWKFNWHIKSLCKIAEDEIFRIKDGIPKDKDIIINVPPRTMKSYIFSICLNAWAWTHSPHLKFMTLSYSDNLSAKFSYKTRLLIQSDWYQKYFNVTISDDNNKKTEYSNTDTGTRESFGWTGSVTGSGADVIIADDPQKASDTSQVKLDHCIDVWRDTVYNRLNDPLTGVRIIIQQRVAENDLTGYLLSTDKELYNHICLPMELTEDVSPQYADKYDNGLLWEDRFPISVLGQYSRNKWTYSSQYLQNPIPKEGDLIKRNWFNVIDRKQIPDKEFHSLKWEMIIDSAYTADIKNDETGCLIIAKWKNAILIRKSFVWYKEFPDLIKAISSAYREYNIRIIRIEPKASGLSILQQLRSQGFNITKTIAPKDDKVTRVTSITPNIEGGHVYLIKNSGEELLLQQCAAFPNSNKDGLVDCLYYSVEKNLVTTSHKKYAVG